MTLEFKEKVIAGGSRDFATVRHLMLRGTNREIGARLAEVALRNHSARPFPAADTLVTRCRNNYFRLRYPTHYERMRGAAEASGHSVPNESIDCGEIWYDLNIAPGCSVVYYPAAYTANGHSILSRNYDFGTGPAMLPGLAPKPNAAPATGHPYLIEVYPDKGIPSLYMCAYDLLGGCIDGINAHGLTVALLADDETMGKYPLEPTIRPAVGLNEINVMRMLLDTCTDAEDALQALHSHKHYYSVVLCHYIIGDRYGNSFVWEYSHCHNREFVTVGRHHPQIVTNHPVYKYASVDDLPHEDQIQASSYTRYRKLTQRLAEKPNRLSVDEIKANNACVAMTTLTIPPGSSDPHPTRTLWHAVYDTHEKSMEISYYLREDTASPNGTHRSPYLRFQLAG